MINSLHDKQQKTYLGQYASQVKLHYGGIFAPGRDIHVVRTPACLEILGGSVFYTGSTVIGKTLENSTIVGSQQRTDNRILARYMNTSSKTATQLFNYSIQEFLNSRGDGVRLDRIRGEYEKNPSQAFGAIILGTFAILLKEGYLDAFGNGANIGICSDVPLNDQNNALMTLSVSTLWSLKHLYDISLDTFQLAQSSRLLMDSLQGVSSDIVSHAVCSCGKANSLTAIKCQPHELLNPIAVPKGYELIGIHTNSPNADSRGAYNQARTAVFIGQKILFTRSGFAQAARPYGGFLANISSKEWEDHYKSSVPARISGREFISRFGEGTDEESIIVPDKNYQPKKSVHHAILENHRCQQFMERLTAMHESDNQSLMAAVGRLLSDSHDSLVHNLHYGRKDTNMLIELLRTFGSQKGILGAKLSGSLNSGLVVILVKSDALDAIRNVATQYFDKTGVEPVVMTGSSPGACEIPPAKIRFD
jgi:galactokinase